ncbi:uncharacterized protein LOC116348117 [Contarinia nasturtii]|uniref:uncharacterized protein LOC116348117 n=1 Tax=Contarinia nasturtii TaxID=265458 RepID=UPI0012D4760B|nr:uncharacterized protein LOC116348117 [Contarinia nasturtii]XP_031634854.1 uncharacterized protein LOC116348117 [Contarinia nasturtii]XP_031634859.1 uncharacterized protein LOC116348117 [Contarinia nasturtii]XP_031634867.1 uncharacterized protein LOC116348117 [Contarinia nasturtii]
MRSLEAMKICFFLISLVCLFGATTAIECYQCNSEFDPRCGDPFDPYSLGKVNCSLKTRLEHLPNVEPVLCRKTTQKIFGKIRVVRDCGYLVSDNDNKGCLKKSGTFEVQNYFCSCTNDLCNTASIKTQQFSLFALSAVLVTAIFRLH